MTWDALVWSLVGRNYQLLICPGWLILLPSSSFSVRACGKVLFDGQMILSGSYQRALRVLALMCPIINFEKGKKKKMSKRVQICLLFF